MWTSDHVLEFPYTQWKVTLAELASHFEAHSLAGIEGMANRHMLLMIELRSKLKDVINGELESIIGKVRMFCSPSELSHAEVNVLLGAWTTKTTYFCMMDKEEWDKWRVDYNTRSAPPIQPLNGATSNNVISGDIPQDTPPPLIDQTSVDQAQDILSSSLQDTRPADSQITNTLLATLTPSIFIDMTVTQSSGSGTVGVWQCKKRKDAGVKRGPCKNKTSTSPVDDS
ncbi:hypothetical protein C0992_001537 [Termitomyces sp. T32_za158]|nr:hypothetical protein C0992_001537 [Termitomyces sp. T32_za158]